MTQQVARARVTLPSTYAGLDNCTIDFVAEATGASPTLDFVTATQPQQAIEAFFNTANTTNALCYYMSPDIDHSANACKIDWYDVTNHLDGSPVGGPFRTDTFTLGVSASGQALHPAAAVVVATRRDYGSDIEHGGSASLPSSEAAIDQGAPATHTGNIKPRARDRGRFYFGPLGNTAAGTHAGSLATTFNTDLTAALHTLFATQNSGMPNQFNFVQWSRRNASINPIRWFYINEGMGVIRKRGDTTQSRVHPWIAV